MRGATGLGALGGLLALLAGCFEANAPRAESGRPPSDAVEPAPFRDQHPTEKPERPSAEKDESAIDTSLIPPSAFAVAVLDVKRLRSSAELKNVPLEYSSLLDAEIKSGLNPAMLQRVTILATTPDPGAPGAFSATIFQFADAESARDYDPLSELENFRPGREVYRPHERTVVFGDASAVERIRTARGEPGLLVSRLQNVESGHDLVVVIDGALAGPVIGANRPEVMESLGTFARNLFEAVNKTKCVTLTASISSSPLARLVIEPQRGESSAELRALLEEAFQEGISYYAPFLRGPFRDQQPGFAALIEKLLTGLRFTEEQGSVVVTAARPPDVKEDLAKIFAPLIQTAEESAGQSGSRKHLRRIALAIHIYHNQQSELPPAYLADEEGKPLLSWRVLVLPYLEEGNLYERIRLNEPWDSEHNRQFHGLMPSVYAFPGERARNGIANYMIVYAGDSTNLHTPFKSARLNSSNGSFKSQTSFQSVTDGLSSTLLVAEVAGSDVNWMEPQDLPLESALYPINSTRDGSTISSPWEGGANAAMGDGRVVFLPDTMPFDTLRRLLLCNDGERVDPP